MKTLKKVLFFAWSLIDPVGNDLFYKGYVEVDGFTLGKALKK